MIESIDRKEHFNNIVKSINQTCFKKCFNANDYKLNNTCAKICYEKYIKTISFINSKSIEIGSVTDSEIINKLYHPKRNLFEEELIFPIGGTFIMNPVFVGKYMDDATVYAAKGINDFLPLHKNR